MDLQLTEVEGHIVIKGANRAAVEAAVEEKISEGYRQMEAIQPLGNNWIATVRLDQQVQPDWCEVTSIGLQLVIEASTERVVREKIEELTTFGAVVIAGPECLAGKWVAVVDKAAVAPTVRR
jgi:hypothetical protein